MSGKKLTARGERRRQNLMDAAAALFAEKGYHATSVADIVRHERVGKGVFYWYFSSKEEIFAEILRQAMAGLRHAQGEAIAGVSDPLERIDNGVRATLEYYARNRALFGLLEMAATDDAFTSLLRKGRETAIADTVRHLKEGIVEGQIRDGDPYIQALCIVGVATHLVRATVTSDLDADGAVVEEAVAFCLEGLRAR